MTCGPLREDLAVIGDAGPRRRRSAGRRVPMRMRVGRVHRDHRRRLGEAVALEDDQPRGVEELVDLGRERRAARHEVAQPAARALRAAWRRPACRRSRTGRRASRRGRVPPARSIRPPLADAARPEEDPLLHGARPRAHSPARGRTSSRRGAAPTRRAWAAPRRCSAAPCRSIPRTRSTRPTENMR